MDAQLVEPADSFQHASLGGAGVEVALESGMAAVFQRYVRSVLSGLSGGFGVSGLLSGVFREFNWEIEL